MHILDMKHMVCSQAEKALYKVKAHDSKLQRQNSTKDENYF